MTSSIQESSKVKVNGTLLPRYVGKAVYIIGTVIQTEPSGMSFKIRSSDSQIITIQMQDPIQELLEGVVEVQGMATQRNTILCHSYILFPKDATSNCDFNLCNEATLLMAKYPEYYVAM